MGMFDNISVSEELPFSQEMKELGLDKNNLTFQTKDLDCLMDTYIIQSNKLFIQKYKTERWVEGDKNSKNLMDRIGHLEREDPYFERIFHHGEIYFYEFVQDVQNKWDCWVEFKAIFTQGNLEKIELHKFEKNENATRKQQEKEFNAQLERESNIWYNKYFLHTIFYRKYISHVWYKVFNRLGNLCHNISHKL